MKSDLFSITESQFQTRCHDGSESILKVENFATRLLVIRRSNQEFNANIILV